MSNGTQWRLIGNQATPRQTNSVTPVSIAGPNQSMIGTPGGEYIVTLAGKETPICTIQLPMRTSPAGCYTIRLRSATSGQ